MLGVIGVARAAGILHGDVVNLLKGLLKYHFAPSVRRRLWRYARRILRMIDAEDPSELCQLHGRNKVSLAIPCVVLPTAPGLVGKSRCYGAPGSSTVLFGTALSRAHH